MRLLQRAGVLALFAFSAACGSEADDVAGSAGQGGEGAWPGSAGSSGAGAWPGSGGGGSVAGSGAWGEAGAAGAAGGEPDGPPADCPRIRVKVPAGEVLNVRPDPSTAQAPVATLANGSLAEVLAEVSGENIEGNPTWYQIVQGSISGYVSAVFAECTTDEPPKPPDGYFMPLPCGMSAKITQGPNGAVSHSGIHHYAYDFGVALDTPVVAMADGVVTHTFGDTGPGDPCYGGGGPSCSAYGNYVVLQHGDGQSTLYKHLNTLSVAVGQSVKRGSTIGLSGSTGYSTGPHLHAMLMSGCGGPACQSVPLNFADVGSPAVYQVVTSGNCP